MGRTASKLGTGSEESFSLRFCGLGGAPAKKLALVARSAQTRTGLMSRGGTHSPAG